MTLRAGSRPIPRAENTTCLTAGQALTTEGEVIAVAATVMVDIAVTAMDMESTSKLYSLNKYWRVVYILPQILISNSRLNDYKPSNKKWDLSRLPRLEKNFYKEVPSVAARSDVRTKTPIIKTGVLQLSKVLSVFMGC